MVDCSTATGRPRRGNRLGVALASLWLGLLLVASPPAAAQEATPPPPRLADTTEAALARMSDAEVRAMLTAELARREASDTHALTTAALTSGMSAGLEGARDRLVALVTSVRDVPTVVDEFVAALAGDSPRTLLLLAVVYLPLTLLAGVAAERFVRRASRQAVAGLRERAASEGSPGARLAAGGLILATELAATAAFVLAAIVVVLVSWQGYEPRRDLVLVIVAAYASTRLFAAFSRMLLAPGDGRLRLVAFDDAEARRLHRGLVRTAAIAVGGFLACGLIALSVGEGTVHSLLNFFVGLGLVASLAWTLHRGRSALRRDLLLGAEPSPFRRVIADAVPGAIMVLVLAVPPVFLVAYAWEVPLSPTDALATLALLVFVPHLDAVLARAAVEGSPVTRDAAAPLLEDWRSIRLRVARLALWLASFWVLARIYAVDLQAVVAAGVGERLSSALFDIVLTVFLAYVGWQALRLAIDRRLADEAGPTAAGERGDEGGAGASRLATLLPLLRVTVQIVIAVMATLVVLSSLGVNIGPLLAGAGVVGLAVGFGAQTLVRDIVSGVFFLVDDAFRTGEYIDVGDVKGTVEKISLRSLRLRHHRGYLHTIPFGEIRHLTNFSRDWVIMKIEFRVPFDTDIELVRKIFKQIGKDLLAHPEIGEDFLEPFKSQGVYTMDDSALVVRGKFTAKPGKQFMARREIYNAVQRAFAEHGIRFADRRVTVQVADADALSPEEQARAIEAGASALRATAVAAPASAAGD